MMSQTLTLPSEVYRKFAQGAAERGMTIEALLRALAELVSLPGQPTEQDRQRSERIEELLQRLRSGTLAPDDRAMLDELISADYEAANTRADQLIRAKDRVHGDPPSADRKPNGASRSRKRARK
jgi:hypothetical protein